MAGTVVLGMVAMEGAVCMERVEEMVVHGKVEMEETGDMRVVEETVVAIMTGMADMAENAKI